MHLYHMTDSANKNHSVITRSSSHVIEASIEREILFCKHTVLYIAYEVGISCKGPFSAVLYGFFLPRKLIVCTCISNSTRGCLHSEASMVTSQHRCHCLSRFLWKHFTIGRMTLNPIKNIIGNVASSYQVNLAIDNPHITENYINSHLFTCHI